jgi:hypothetical protein
MTSDEKQPGKDYILCQVSFFIAMEARREM